MRGFNTEIHNQCVFDPYGLNDMESDPENSCYTTSLCRSTMVDSITPILKPTELTEPDRTCSITNGNFSYEIVHSCLNNYTKITATETKEYLKWQATISSDLTESTTSDSKIKLSPASLFNIFNDCSLNALKDSMEINLPNAYKTEDSQLTIEIITKFAYAEDHTKHIILNPLILDDKSRFAYKLDERDKKIINLNAKIIEHEEQISKLRNEIDTLSTLFFEAIRMIESGDTANLKKMYLPNLQY